MIKPQNIVKENISATNPCFFSPCCRAYPLLVYPPDPASHLSAKSANQTHQSKLFNPRFQPARPPPPSPAATAASSRDPVSGAPPTARPHPQGELRTGRQERRRPGRQERRRRATLCSAPRGVGGGRRLREGPWALLLSGRFSAAHLLCSEEKMNFFITN